METLEKKTEAIEDFKENLDLEKSKLNNEIIKLNGKKIFEWTLYFAGLLLILLSVIYLFKDLKLTSSGDVYYFQEKSYVGGDAYNFLISATRSIAVMVKSLIFAILGSTSIIVGRLTAILNK